MTLGTWSVRLLVAVLRMHPGAVGERGEGGGAGELDTKPSLVCTYVQSSCMYNVPIKVPALVMALAPMAIEGAN